MSTKCRTPDGSCQGSGYTKSVDTLCPLSQQLRERHGPRIVRRQANSKYTAAVSLSMGQCVLRDDSNRRSKKPQTDPLPRLSREANCSRSRFGPAACGAICYWRTSPTGLEYPDECCEARFAVAGPRLALSGTVFAARRRRSPTYCARRRRDSRVTAATATHPMKRHRFYDSLRSASPSSARARSSCGQRRDTSSSSVKPPRSQKVFARIPDEDLVEPADLATRLEDRYREGPVRAIPMALRLADDPCGCTGRSLCVS